MNRALQVYLAVIGTFIALLLAAILGLLIFAGLKLSQQVRAIDAKASDLSSKVDAFNENITKLNSSIKGYNPFN